MKCESGGKGRNQAVLRCRDRQPQSAQAETPRPQPHSVILVLVTLELQHNQTRHPRPTAAYGIANTSTSYTMCALFKTRYPLIRPCSSKAAADCSPSPCSIKSWICATDAPGTFSWTSLIKFCTVLGLLVINLLSCSMCSFVSLAL